MEPLRVLLRSAATILKNVNGHSCTCSGCVEEEQAARKLVAEIEAEL